MTGGRASSHCCTAARAAIARIALSSPVGGGGGDGNEHENVIPRSGGARLGQNGSKTYIARQRQLGTHVGISCTVNIEFSHANKRFVQTLCAVSILYVLLLRVHVYYYTIPADTGTRLRRNRHIYVGGRNVQT